MKSTKAKPKGIKALRQENADLAKRAVLLQDAVTRLKNERDELRNQIQAAEANSARLRYLTARHSALEEWANAARRVVFAFPGVTSE